MSRNGIYTTGISDKNLAYNIIYDVETGERLVDDWELDCYREIVISTKLNEMENGSEFLAWLKENAVKQ